jgi:hypothetical protein
VTIAGAQQDLRTVVRYGKRAVAAAFRPGADPEYRAGVLAAYAGACAELGRSDEALAVLDEMGADPYGLSEPAFDALLGLR